MKCPSCKQLMQWGTAPLSIDRNGYQVFWDAIPAWLCDQCGEPLFEAREVDLVQSALFVLDRETAILIGQSSR